MKNVTIKEISATVVAVVIAILFVSCEQVKDIASVSIPVKPSPVVFNIEERGFAAVISQRVSTIGDMVLYQNTLNTKLNHYLEKNGFSYENVRGFNLVKVEVKAVERTDYDMSGFVGMKLYIGGENELVAEAKSVSSDKKTLTLEISKAELQEYTKSDDLPILVKGPNPVSREESVKLSMQLEFEAKVTPLK